MSHEFEQVHKAHKGGRTLVYKSSWGLSESLVLLILLPPSGGFLCSLWAMLPPLSPPVLRLQHLSVAKSATDALKYEPLFTLRVLPWVLNLGPRGISFYCILRIKMLLAPILAPKAVTGCEASTCMFWW